MISGTVGFIFYQLISINDPKPIIIPPQPITPIVDPEPAPPIPTPPPQRKMQQNLRHRPPFIKQWIKIPINRYRFEPDKFQKQWQEMQIGDYWKSAGRNIVKGRDHLINKTEEWVNDSAIITEARRSLHYFRYKYAPEISIQDVATIITNMKFKMIEDTSYQVRMIESNAIAALVALRTLSKHNKKDGVSRSIVFAVRNSAIAYAFSAWILAPEIFNPLILQK